MVIEQTVAIPASRRLHLDFELPLSVPAGLQAQIAIHIPTPQSAHAGEPEARSVRHQSFRGILKGRGITLERFREMQAEDKAIEDAADGR